MRTRSWSPWKYALPLLALVGSVVAAALGLGAAAGTAPPGVAAAGARAVIYIVAAENEYADVLSQIGGHRVSIVGIISNPTIDPHTYESSTKDASAIAHADLVVQNGLGYDSFMGKLEVASPNPRRLVLSVGESRRFKTGDNPHIWYDPPTMPYVAAWAAAALARLDPANAPLFRANARAFDASMSGYTTRLAALRKRFAGVPVAVTEPVFGYALHAAGLTVLTPPSFQLAIMQGNDPAPQDMQVEENLLKQKKVRLLAYNQQAVAPVTARLWPLARAARVPVVGVYETKPPSMHYQQWMIAEVEAVRLALARGISTERLH
ncbi:MAG: metal ABC transporter solute-binding protein [Chloroflexota bacterium]